MKGVCPFYGKAGLLLPVGLTLLLLAAPVWAGQEIKSIPTREGVTLKVLLNVPPNPVKAVLIMFPGGDGANMFKEEDGKIRLGRNFLVRTSPQFVKQGLAVAIVDVPSDHSHGMPNWFRNSSDHGRDISKVIEFLDNQGLKPIYLVGTSLGTLSVAYLGLELKDNRIKGLILTSTVTRHVQGLRLGHIPFPTLLVHHREDGCEHCPFRDAAALKTRFSGTSRVDFVEVQGGSPPQSGPCLPLSYHGFLGREEQVVQVISNWIAGGNIPTQIGN